MVAARVAADWDLRATQMQKSLDQYFAAPGPQLFNNWYPASEHSNAVFNYWWLAHLVEARLDAFARTGEGRWLTEAITTNANIIERNQGSLFNDYFDDMQWFAIANLRLSDASGRKRYLDQAVQLWEHVLDHGWNDIQDGGICWRRQQPYYKNTASNGTFAILSARLFRTTGRPDYLEWAQRAMDWLERTLVSHSGFVQDGINRLQDGRIDTDWRYTYNQGLYIGACAELAQITGEHGYLARALRTAHLTFSELGADGVLIDHGDGGDEGLFKGIFVRYAGDLALAMDDRPLRALLERAVDILWQNGLVDPPLLAGPDWRHSPGGAAVPYSTQLSAIIATELRARLDRAPTG